jgi:predicted N-acyltransferase
LVSGVSEIDEEDWNALVGGPDGSPFVEWGFLSSLEDAGTLGKKAGWVPRIVAVRDRGRLIAAAPAYLKSHSQGEFVFDFAFADLAGRLGLRYYPKLLVGVPFTPATGGRLLTVEGADRLALMRVLASALIEMARELRLSSVHVNFAKPDEVALLREQGFVERHGIQYHWYRRGAERFDDYLARFNSKRRNQLKRERRELADQGIGIETLVGDALEDERITRLAFELYKSTVEKFYWGHQYLNLEFFRIVRERMKGKLELVLARKKDGEPVAGALNIGGARRLYGRYWGAREEIRFLHFNVCYYRGIEECIARKLDVFEPGAGGEHKLVRGFEPTVTQSAHWFADERFGGMIARYVGEEREAIARALAG